VKDQFNIIKMPQSDVNDTSATLIEWLALEGSYVNRGDPICTIETSKAAFDIESDYSGYIMHLLDAGKDILVSTPIAIIGRDVKVVNKEKEKYLGEGNCNLSSGKVLVSNVKATNKARELALKYNIDLEDIKSEGIIKEKDVVSLLDGIEKQNQSNSENKFDIERHIELIGNQKVGKDLMLESIKNIPQSYVEKEIATTELEKFINDYMENEGKYITVLSVILHCLGKSLKKNKVLNSYREDDKICIYQRINVGIVINNDHNISIPVIKDIDQLTPSEIVMKLFSVRKDLMNKKPKIDDLIGGTFTVSPMDHTDVKRFVPIIHPKQAAVLAIPKIQIKNTYDSKGNMAQINYMNLGLTFDHSFLNAVHAIELLNCIEDEMKLLIENEA